jgi:peptidoglycan/xylan/chitin deacetylase (PgdA/CDA1 family)
MSPFRILLLSYSRPLRAWRLALRLIKEIPGTEIRGIVQRPLGELPLTQQEMVFGGAARRETDTLPLERAGVWLRRAWEELLHSALWWIHGCPPDLNPPIPFTVESLKKCCASMSWPCMEADSFGQDLVQDFIRRNPTDLIILLGPDKIPLDPNVLPEHGMLRVREGDTKCGAPMPQRAADMLVEHIARNSSTALASLTLPSQPDDGPLGFTLKADLLANDLLLQAVASAVCRKGIPSASDVSEWMQRTVSPYLDQLTPAVRRKQCPETGEFCRPFWRLLLESLMLCSPLIVTRNWLRRLRGRYPVLIVAHHLVSDRRHRLGISTEGFWRQVRFLQRHYQVVGLSEAVTLLQSGRSSGPAVALTFDDGYADNFVSLRAVAEETGIPVTLFITTEPVSTHTEFRHDVLNGQHGALPLTWDQIRYWGRRGAEFGSHTRTHANCGTTDRAKLKDEILGARSDLEFQIGESVPYFAFPFGKLENMSEEAVALSRSGYRCFLSFCGGENVPASGEIHSHLFRKIAYPEPWELELELQSIFDFAGTARRRLARARQRSREVADGHTAATGSSGGQDSVPLTENATQATCVAAIPGGSTGSK